MSPSLDAASRLATDPMPDPRDWIPAMDGIVSPGAIDSAGGAAPAATANAPRGDNDDASAARGSAAIAFLTGPAADGFAGALRITGAEGATLVVDPERDAYYFESTRLLPLAPLLALPAAAWTPVYSKSLAETRGNSAAQALARLRWFAGLVASPGVLDPALDRNARFQLAHWVTIEREFPRHFRIAKQFFGCAVTIVEAAAAASVTTAEVVDYVNAGIRSGALKIAA